MNSKKKRRIVILAALCLPVLCVIFLFSTSIETIRYGTCIWDGQVDIHIIDAATGQGVKGIQIYLGSGTFGISNNVGNTDSEGRCVNQQEVWWDSITIENYWSGNTRKTKQGPNLGLVKENYCKDKQELIEFTKATEKKIAIKVSMKPAEGDNPDSPFVIDSVEVHGEK